MYQVIFNEEGLLAGIYTSVVTTEVTKKFIIVNEEQYSKILELNRQRELQYLFNSSKDISNEDAGLIDNIFKVYERKLSAEGAEYNKKVAESIENASSQQTMNAQLLKSNAVLTIQNREQQEMNAQLLKEIAKLKV